MYEAGVKIAEKIGFFKTDKDIENELKMERYESKIYELEAKLEES
mgnify:CR=1 FL=1